MDADGDRTGVNVVLPDDDTNTGGNTGGNSDGTDNTSGNMQQNAKMVLFAIIAVLVIGLYVIGKGGGDELDLAGEARIEKIWDETELEESEVTPFIPAPPPMAKTESKSEEEYALS